MFFNINTSQIPALQAVYGGSDDVTTIGLLVKNIDLPSYQVTVDTMNQYNRKRLIHCVHSYLVTGKINIFDTMNQYNRKRLVQSKMDYNPVNINFHDDSGDLIRNMWYNYYSYYYKDPTQPYDNVPAYNGSLGRSQVISNGFGYNTRDTYSNGRQVNDWGYVGESYADGTGAAPAAGNSSGKPPFFRDIRIYGLSQKKFASYVLINPMVTNWRSEQYDYSDGAGTMAHAMEIRYETVKYYTGAIGGQTPSATVPGFADPAHYDLMRSSLARSGSTQTVFGQGGLVDAAAGIVEDLNALASGRGSLQNVIGAVQQGGAAYNTFKGKNIKSIANQDAQNALNQYIQQGLPGATRSVLNNANGVFFPKPPVSK